MRTALTYLEQVAGCTRRGAGGATLEPAALTFATFQHSTSRAQDPQLHTHALLLNLGLRADGTTGTLHSLPVFREKMNAGAIYQTELAAGLRQRLGLALEPEHVGFHIRGVPKELCRQFSQRRQDIEQELARRGKDNAVAAKVAALETRPEKECVARTELVARWQKAGAEFGWSAKQAEQLRRQGPEPSAAPPDWVEDLHRAVAALPPAHRTQARCTRMAVRHAIKQGADATQFQEGLASLGRESDQDSQKPGRRGLVVEWRRLFDRTPWVPVRPQVLHAQWQSLFPNAPWKPAQKLKLPVLVAALPALGRRPLHRPRWWTIR